jgi:Zn-dependent peptidase ImmA (M78 family)
MKLSELTITKQEAFNFRRVHGLSAAEPLNLDSLLLQLNVQTVFIPLKKVSGMAIKVENKGHTHRFILINSNHTLGRQNFTICHELYHLFVQKGFVFKVCNQPMFDKRDIEEYRADLFASALLMPEDGLTGMLLEENFDPDNKEMVYPTILKLEQYFGCSRSALLYKLANMGYPQLQKGKPLQKDLSKDIALQAQQYGYDLRLYKSANANRAIGDYGEMAKRLFNASEISEAHYATLMENIFVNIYTPQNDEPENE